jgi:hypothetical protein
MSFSPAFELQVSPHRLQVRRESHHALPAGERVFSDVFPFGSGQNPIKPSFTEDLAEVVAGEVRFIKRRGGFPPQRFAKRREGCPTPKRARWRESLCGAEIARAQIQGGALFARSPKKPKPSPR